MKFEHYLNEVGKKLDQYYIFAEPNNIIFIYNSITSQISSVNIESSPSLKQLSPDTKVFTNMSKYWDICTVHNMQMVINTQTPDSTLSKLLSTFNNDADNILKEIKKNCSKWIKESGGRIFHRGLELNPPVSNIAIKTSRKDRKPKDTPQFLHDMLDKNFKKKFGWNVRSEGVFTKSGRVGFYGEEYLFFPIGDYEYVWSSRISDLYDNIHATDIKHVNIEDDKNSNVQLGIIRKWINVHFYEFYEDIDWPLPGDPLNKDIVMKLVNTIIMDIVVDYKNTKLEDAHIKGHEVAVKCDRYYIVNSKYKPYLENALKDDK